MAGLVGWWPLHENSGTKAYDLSGNENHGSLNGGITQGVAGKGGLTSYSFDGNDDYVALSTIPSKLQLGNNQSSTIVSWVKIGDGGSINKIISARNSNSRGFVLSVRDWDGDGDQEASIYFRNPSNGNSDYYAGETKIDDGEWHHIVGMRVGVDSNDNSEFRLFVDGEEESPSTESYQGAGTFTVSSSFDIGRESNGGSHLKGLISDARAYNRALTPEEVQELYKWGSGDYVRPLNDQNSPSAVSRWAFDGDATDSWGNNNGANNGGGYERDSIRGKSLKFQRSDNDYVSTPVSTMPVSGSFFVWVKSMNEGTRQVVWENYGGSGDDLFFELFTADGDIRVIIDQSGERAFANGLSAGAWHHIGYTVVSSGISLYLNGRKVDSVSGQSISDIDNGNNFYLGTRPSDNSFNNFDGFMDDARLYNRALSPSEVFELYRWGTRGRDLRKQLVNQR